MGVLKFYEKNGKVVFYDPKGNLRLYDADGDLIATNGESADTVHIKFSENLSTYLVYDLDWDRIFQDDGITNWGTDRATTVSNLNNDLLNIGLPYPSGVAIEVKNDHGSALSKGDPVVFKSYDGLNDILEVELARADNSAKMPAQYILQEDIANGLSGKAVAFGLLDKMDTDSFSTGDQLYVAPTGGLTATIPTGNNIVQEVAIALNSRAAPQGAIMIQGLGNDESRLSDAAISGDYDDLTNTPDIPFDVETYDFAGDRNLNTNGNDFNLKNGAVIALQFDASASQVNVTLPLGLSNKTSGGQAKFLERPLNGNNAITIKAPDALSADTTYTLPSADGTSGQFLKTDGSGNLSFDTAGGSDPIIPLTTISGRYQWASTDNNERVYTGSTSYGPFNWYNFTSEPGQLAIRTYSGTEVAGTTSVSMSSYLLIAYAIKNPYSTKKVRLDYDFRIYGSPSVTSGTPFGFSIWSANAATSGSSGSTTYTYRGESSDHAVNTSSIAHYHGSFTTSAAITDDYILVLPEHRNTTGINGTTYMYANFTVYMVD